MKTPNSIFVSKKEMSASDSFVVASNYKRPNTLEFTLTKLADRGGAYSILLSLANRELTITEALEELGYKGAK